MWMIILIPLLIILSIRAIIITVYDEVVEYREQKEYDRIRQKVRKDVAIRRKERNRIDELNEKKSTSGE